MQIYNSCKFRSSGNFSLVISRLRIKRNLLGNAHLRYIRSWHKLYMYMYCTLNTVAASFLIMFCCVLSSGALNVDRLHLSRLFLINFLQYVGKLAHLHKGPMSRRMCLKDRDMVLSLTWALQISSILHYVRYEKIFWFTDFQRAENADKLC